jgi:cell division septation protein DedD
MAENRREKDRRFYFTRAQMALLGGAFALTSVIVFVMGMFVGKEIEARKIVTREESFIKVPVKPASRGAADADGAKIRDDLTFYNTLTKAPDPIAEPKTEEKAQPVTAKTVTDSGAETRETKESSGAKTAAKPWSVQVNSFPDAKSAQELIDRLKNKGYNAFVTEANVNGKTWYRVRVGRFTSRDEAEKTEVSLRAGSYPKAFATRK